MFCFSGANHASTNLKKFLSWKLDKFTLFTHSLVGWNLQTYCVNSFFRLSWHLSKKNSFFLKHLFLQTKNWWREQAVRVHDLATGKNLSFNQCHNKQFEFFLGKVNLQMQEKTFFRICIAWYKYWRGWENSRQLCKPQTNSRVCITVSNSPNPRLLYITGYANTEK